MSAIQWKQPPPSRSDQINWDSIAEQLRDNPGRWALVAPAYGKRKCLPAESRGLTVISRSTPEGRFDVYAKFDA
ncbi:hypothetical protein J2X12_002854 [Pseudarthrobacter oxydans]|uniref:Uncharacterized protein n=1 Tax=Pseudarthrobacter oxydans TaxID=1671 RepID=A0AAW8ND86_PSEOX|nr:hypothetical protein [Pseudarthrobacter oxydans]MDR6794843.1 hypothetical protein [Pseudarthrobacter oxydans]MDR7164816.1 hypothetical protein [Pseudarthrobacter oxydans]